MGFFDDLLAALADVAGIIEQAVAFIFSLLVQVAQFLWAGLQLVGKFFFTLLQDVGKFFQHVWDNFFKGIFSHILQGIESLGKFLHNIFGPVVRWLRNASRFIDLIYRRYLRPILRWIQIARVFLQLLRALHIKWAGKLDSILGKVQHDIQQGYLFIKGILNTVIDLLNILTDPTNLLRRPTTLLSIRRILNALIRQVTGLPPGFFIPSPSKFAPLGLGSLPHNFDPRNPLHNPPPSYYLGLDSGVPSFETLGPGETIDDTAADLVGPLDFFSSVTVEQATCIDPVQCLNDAARIYTSGGG